MRGTSLVGGPVILLHWGSFEEVVRDSIVISVKV